VRRNSAIGGPEIVGLAILGATIGAVACGATVSDLTLRVAVGALLGGAAIPALVLFPWRRLVRLRPHRAIGAPREAGNS